MSYRLRRRALDVQNQRAILLGVNIDHVATLRQARHTVYPDPVMAAVDAEQAGADAITLHLREDRRHIQEHDVERLRGVLQKRTRINLEMAVTEEMLRIAERYRPEDCCLVPERREELTTEGGLDVRGQEAKIRAACQRLATAGCRVSLFVDADLEQVEAAARIGAPVIELHTGHYADAASPGDQAREMARIVRAAEHGREAGMQVNAGHGLSYDNVTAVAALAMIRELNIGHAIVARAVFIGMQAAVREMKHLMETVRVRI